MNYLKTINKVFTFWNIIKSAIIFAFSIIAIDYLNIPSQFIKKDLFLTIFIFIVLLLLIIIDFIKSQKSKTIISKNINILDRNIFISLITILIYSIYLINDFKLYKIIILSISLGILLFTLTWRILYMRHQLKQIHKIPSNICDLKEFLENDIPQNASNKLILFKESDVEYDLLNRSIFVDHIASLINYCNPEKNFVIALNGPWGSGKSTILNLVKKSIENSNDIIIIDNFDPWRYNDNETLFRGFFDSITKNENFAFDYSLYKKLYNIYKVLVLGNDNIFNTISFDLHFGDDSYSIDELKRIISTHLKINNKKVVFIIDNIDRLDKEQILIIFKTISTLFDFDNFVYLLSFDEERINKIFADELNIDPNYLNKIINSNISLPNVNPHIISKIAVQSIEKMYEYYDIKLDIDEKQRFITMFSQLSLKLNDLRNLKRFLNYISPYIQSKDIQEQVNIEDFITMQLLKYLNIDLYNTIYNAPSYFVFEDEFFLSYYDESLIFNDSTILSDDFYHQLFSVEKNKEYKLILSMLFPSVNSFFERYKEEWPTPFDYEFLYGDSLINKRIFNGRYFEHYFELTPNKYSMLVKDINDFIDLYNKKDNFDEIVLYYRTLINSDKENQKLKLEILDQSLNKFYPYKIIHLIDIIYNNMDDLSLNDINDTKIFLPSKKMCILIIARVLNIIDPNLAKEKIKYFINKRSNIYDIITLLNWLDDEKHIPFDFSPDLYKFAEDIFMQKLNTIIDNKIDIFSDPNYTNYTIVSLNPFPISPEKIKSYISSILNKKNIFKILMNFITESQLQEYCYKLNIEKLNMFISEEDINNMLSSIDYNLNIDQKRVRDIFYRHIVSYEIPINYDNL